VKLATELSKRDTGKTLFILDEPTTGLHFADVHKLLEVLTRLRDAGNSLVIIEHNLDVVKTADWIIDMGPEGGTDRFIFSSPGISWVRIKKSSTG
jgi:excinuclease ABC subunit A